MGSPLWGRRNRLLCFQLDYNVCAACHSLFTLPLGIIDRLCAEKRRNYPSNLCLPWCRDVFLSFFKMHLHYLVIFVRNKLNQNDSDGYNCPTGAYSCVNGMSCLITPFLYFLSECQHCQCMYDNADPLIS